MRLRCSCIYKGILDYSPWHGQEIYPFYLYQDSRRFTHRSLLCAIVREFDSPSRKLPIRSKTLEIFTSFRPKWASLPSRLERTLPRFRINSKLTDMEGMFSNFHSLLNIPTMATGLFPRSQKSQNRTPISPLKNLGEAPVRTRCPCCTGNMRGWRGRRIPNMICLSQDNTPSSYMRMRNPVGSAH